MCLSSPQTAFKGVDITSAELAGCDCQCSKHIQVNGQTKEIEGNCKTSNADGALFCFIDAYQNCPDSSTVGSKIVSSYACATPDPKGPECNYGESGEAGESATPDPKCP